MGICEKHIEEKVKELQEMKEEMEKLHALFSGKLKNGSIVGVTQEDREKL